MEMVKNSGTRYSTAKKRKAALEKLGLNSFDATNYAYSVANDFLPSGYVFCKTDIYCCGKIISMICTSDRNKENQWERIGHVVVRLSKSDLVVIAKTRSKQLRKNYLSTKVVYNKSAISKSGICLLSSLTGEYMDLIRRASIYRIKTARRGLDDVLFELEEREIMEKELEDKIERELCKGVHDAIECMIMDVANECGKCKCGKTNYYSFFKKKQHESACQ